MPEVSITIGGKSFDVACQDGEEAYLKSAAALLDKQAAVLLQHSGRLPEQKMLLMAGLMLADHTVAFEDRATAAEQKVAVLEREIAELKAQPGPEPKTVEVPVVPDQVSATLSELAAQAEALAALAEERTGSA